MKPPVTQSGHSTLPLDLPDIQGNIHRPYGRYGFPHTRHLFFHIGNAPAGRRFIDAVRQNVTTAQPWEHVEAGEGFTKVRKPVVTMNIGFTWLGLLALQLPTETLRLMPDEFIDGMRNRSNLLGDVGPSGREHWDPIWKAEGKDAEVHVWISLNTAADPDGTPVVEMEEWTVWLINLARWSEGVALLSGHGPDGAQWQDSGAIMVPLPNGAMAATPKEHFGFTDGISDPTFAGQYAPDVERDEVVGSGKIASGKYDPGASWSALATGEFILGHPDEAQQIPVATQPHVLMRNGTFMAWRKLHQDVEAFEAAIEAQAPVYQSVAGLPSLDAARELLMAKMVGRWRTGIPLIVAPTWEDHQRVLAEWSDIPAIALDPDATAEQRRRLKDYTRMLSAYRYAEDPDGVRCPVSAHVRRANPRDMLDPVLTPQEGDSNLVNRRRILRRGLPYGDRGGPEHGVIFMAMCASLFRQFEFIQQQWMQYGLDFNVGNDTCPLIGNRDQSDKFVIAADRSSGRLPYIAAKLPQFVVMRGGDYFFIPSMTALRLLAMGTIDPT